jgi:hypothetical protein
MTDLPGQYGDELQLRSQLIEGSTTRIEDNASAGVAAIGLAPSISKVPTARRCPLYKGLPSTPGR